MSLLVYDFLVDEGSAYLAKPEFEGLWDQHKPYKVPKDMTAGPSLPGTTKMEKVSPKLSIG